MDRFQEMQALMRIAERQSFTEAAEDLQIPRATVTNLIKRVEQRLGTRLLERTTRTVRLTQDGEAHYRRCVRLLADVEEAEGSFRNAAPKGQLRVNLQGTLARHFVVPALPDFLARHPELTLHIGEDDRLIDLVREGVDCVLRAGTLQDSSMVGRRVALLPQVTVTARPRAWKGSVRTGPSTTSPARRARRCRSNSPSTGASRPCNSAASSR